MTDKRSQDRPAYESAKTWMDQRKQKSSATASFAPHTPPAQRSISTFSSPGSILGKEEDAVIIELTQRRLYAGIEGDSGPQCCISFGPESNRRVGDYRTWLPGYKRAVEGTRSCPSAYELWHNNVNDVDLGLLSDGLERTVRETYNKHLLVDAGTGRLVLVLPSLVPHPVLETILSTLFQRWKYPSITLLPSPAMAMVAAGLRSGLVVDIGWEETTVTAIYEYREVASRRSTIATKLLTEKFTAFLREVKNANPVGHTLRFGLDFVEEVMTRCMVVLDVTGTYTDARMEAAGVSSQADETRHVEYPTSDPDDSIEVQWPGTPSPAVVKLSKNKVRQIFTSTYFNDDQNLHPDDHETAIPHMVFRTLLSLSADLRGVCMSRIVFTGHGVDSAMLRNQILDRVGLLITSVGWTAVKGRPKTAQRSGLSERAQARTEPADAKHDVQVIPGKDYVEEKLQKQKVKHTQPRVQGSIRSVRSLGSWTGASLLTSLKIRGFVEIERDRFLSHGLSGATRDSDTGAPAQQRMSTFGLPASGKPSDRNSWTLGGWG